MDSLFDASLFDAAPYEAVTVPPVEPDPPEPAELPEPPVGEADENNGMNIGNGGPFAPNDDLDDFDDSPTPEDDTEAGTSDFETVPTLLLETPIEPDGELDIDESILREPSVDELWATVVGQSAAVTQLRASTLTPVHAYLFSGPPGVGKIVAARAFAAALLCPRGGCGRCSVCLRAQAQAHPDLVVIEREGASISVDQAREILRLALRSPVEGDRKVLVLVDFHLVTVAAPTLLKIIEEPPPSTIFVVVAEQVTPELVTIASRCVQVPFSSISRATMIDTLIAEGASSVHAARAADVAGGRLDRARLLVNDPALSSRVEFWERLPARLDGTGAAVSVLVSDAIELLDGVAVGPLQSRQQAEALALDARLEASGPRGGAGARKELAERHKREQKRVRDDELRFGLGVLSRWYGTEVSRGATGAAAAVDAVRLLGEANEHLDRNPNLTLLLQSLLLRLPTPSAR